MAKARIELRKSETYSARGRNFMKNQAVIIDNDADITYFQAQPEFTVTVLKAVAAAPAPVAPAPARDETGDGLLDEEQLAVMSKASVIKLAAERFSLDLDGQMKKGQMIDAILKAQADDTNSD